MTFIMFLQRVTKTAQKGLKINFSSVGEKVTLRGFDPRRDRQGIQKNCPKKAVFLLNSAHFRGKTGVQTVILCGLSYQLSINEPAISKVNCYSTNQNLSRKIYLCTSSFRYVWKLDR